MDKLIPAPPARDHTTVPIYQLYGYGNVWNTPDPLYCETIADQEKLHNWHVTAHKHINLFQILHIRSGQATIFLDSKKRSIKTNSLVFIPSKVVHEFIFEPNSGGHIITITNSLLLNLCEGLNLNLHINKEPIVINLTDKSYDQYIDQSLQQLNQEYSAPFTPQRGKLLESLLINILVCLERKSNSSNGTKDQQLPGYEHLSRYTNLIENNYKLQHSVVWYAKQMGLTAAHLNVIVNNLTGKTALQLIHDRIIIEARRELIYTTRTINIIAEKLGFNDPSYFARFFKRESGKSPKKYRTLTTKNLNN